VTLMPVLLAAACGDPELASELDSEGPPEVLEVNVASESAPTDPNLNAIEAATFCRPGEEFKVNTLYCPLDRDEENAPIPGARAVDGPVVDATPMAWHARFIFSELIDPSIEELIDTDGVITGSIAAADPFVLTCGGAEEPYEGWYDPTGNHLSYPPGPGLVVFANNFIATGTACQVSLRDGVVTDKDGEGVPGDHLGPYDFSIAPLSVGASTPEDATEGVAVDINVEIAFNAPINLDTTDTLIVLVDADGNPVAGTLDFKRDPKTDEITNEEIIVFNPDADLAPGVAYTVTVDDGIEDIAGGLLAQEEPFTASFTTAAE
jgi:Bacterial Ig-like domain